MKALPFFRAITRFGGSRVGMRPVRDVGRLAVTFMLLAGLTAALSSPAIQPAAAQQTDTQEPAPPQAAPGVVRVQFEARMTQNGPAINSGMEWRIFPAHASEDGDLPLLAQAQGGVQAFDMSPGEYLVHAAYGYAGAVRRIVVSPSTTQEIFALNAGALQLYATTGDDRRIPPRFLRFDIYSRQANEAGERQLIARNIRPGEIVPFHSGIYHVVSLYGRLNAEVRADLRVEPGKVTRATIQHRAARMAFRLVHTAGGDAIANTAWSIINESGDLITESSSAFPAFVLSEGNYTAIAKNSDKIYSSDFEVVSGKDREIEVRAE